MDFLFFQNNYRQQTEKGVLAIRVVLYVKFENKTLEAKIMRKLDHTSDYQVVIE